MRNYGLIELNAFVAVATHRNFRKAAAELGISPSALSHAIASLEGHLGVRLFNRTTRSVSISAAGEKFLSRVSPALQQISGAVEEINQYRDTPSGKLRLSTNAGAAEIILIPIILKFLKLYPDMQVDLVTEKSWVDIIFEGFDAGIRLGQGVPQDMVAVPCTPPLRFIIVGAPEYFKKFGTPKEPEDLHSHKCVTFRAPNDRTWRWEFEKGGKKIEIDATGPLMLDNHTLMMEAALSGVGVVRVIDWFAIKYIAEGKLVQVLENWAPPSMGPLYFYYPGHRHATAGVRAFAELIRESPA